MLLLVPSVAGYARRPVQVLLLLKQGVHRLHLRDPSGTISDAKRSTVTTLKLSSLAARLAAVAVEPATQWSDAPGGGGRGGVFIGDLSQRGVVDVEQLGGRLVTQLVLAARTQRGRQQRRIECRTVHLLPWSARQCSPPDGERNGREVADDQGMIRDDVRRVDVSVINVSCLLGI